MIPFMTPEAATKALSELSFHGGANDLANLFESEEALLFSSVLDLLVAGDKGLRPKDGAKGSGESLPIDTTSVVQEDAVDTPLITTVVSSPTPHDGTTVAADTAAPQTVALSVQAPGERTTVPMTADEDVPIAKDSQASQIVAPQIKKQVTFAQTIVEGRLSLPSASGLPSVNDSVPVATHDARQHQSDFREISANVLPKAGHETPVAFSTVVPVKTKNENSYKPILRKEPPLPTLQHPVDDKLRSPRETIDLQKTIRDVVPSDVPKQHALPSTQVQQSLLATPNGFGALPQLEAEKRSSLITGRDVVSDLVPASHSDARAVSVAQNQMSSAAPASAGSEMGRQVANQIAVAISGHQAQATEIALNPKELGRVRLTMTAVDQAITLNIMAERPETVDLMRRNIDALAQEFRALGYGDIAFSFGDGGDDLSGNSDGECHPDEDVAGSDNADMNTISQQRGKPDVGLDLRL